MSIKAKSQYRKQTQRESTKRMRILMRRIEVLSEGVPPSALDEMQLQAVAWSIPECVKLGPEEPSQAKIVDLFNRSFEAQIKRLESYYKEVGRNV